MGKEKGVGALELVVGPMDVGWRSISEGWEIFAKHFSVVVGDGSRTLFWHDKWSGDVLKNLYSQLFLCSANKEACIFDLLSLSVGDNDRVWSSRF